MIVVAEPDQVETDLAAGVLACPRCGGVLCPWAYAASRPVRQLDGTTRTVRPRRARCADCRATQVLLPGWVLPRRARLAAHRRRARPPAFDRAPLAARGTRTTSRLAIPARRQPRRPAGPRTARRWSGPAAHRAGRCTGRARRRGGCLAAPVRATRRSVDADRRVHPGQASHPNMINRSLSGASLPTALAASIDRSHRQREDEGGTMSTNTYPLMLILSDAFMLISNAAQQPRSFYSPGRGAMRTQLATAAALSAARARVRLTSSPTLGSVTR